MEKKQVKNLFNKLIVNKNSVLFGRNVKDLTDNFIKKKLYKSRFSKDVFLSNLFKKINDKPISDILLGNDKNSSIKYRQ